MPFHEGKIDGVECREWTQHHDHRGWLTEVYRQDELNGYEPAMCYLSLPVPGVTRGPQEHREQTDWFVFTGPGTFEIHLWDNRPESTTYGHRQTFVAGDDSPMCVIVPPGVVHGYKNIADVPGLVVNCPNRLFAGWNRSEPVDEIRHEDNVDSPFQMKVPG
jgi:dTDP-4-dehydrorhamnose 3,5-epimerase